MEEKINEVIVNCSYCGKEIPCPEDLSNLKKHSCYSCFDKIKFDKNIEIKDVHVAIPKDNLTEEMTKYLGESIINHYFPKFWDDMKEDLRNLSRKETSLKAFSCGVETALINLFYLLKEHDNTKDKNAI